MTEQRHPADRVTPVEVGDPIRWTAVEGEAVVHGTTDARGCRYVCGPLDDVFVATQVSRVWGHGGYREQPRTLRHCQTMDAAMQACQDAEHARAWGMLSATARELLLGVDRAKAAAAA